MSILLISMVNDHDLGYIQEIVFMKQLVAVNEPAITITVLNCHLPFGKLTKYIVCSLYKMERVFSSQSPA